MHIYLASVEMTDVRFALEQGAVENAFTSYYYLRAKPGGIQRVRQFTKRLIVDSGAHSFFAQTPTIGSASFTVAKAKGENPDEYMSAYLHWLIANADSFDYFVELDIGQLVGQEKVRGWRELIRKAKLAEKCLICYHPTTESLQEFLDAAAKWPSRYVGLEGLRKGKPTYDHVGVVKQLYSMGVRPHGFAMVKRRYLDAVPFYSADSTSFKAAAMYGAHFVFDGKEFSYARPSRAASAAKRERLARLSVRTGMRMDASLKNSFSQNGGKEVTEALVRSAMAMRELENYYTRLWTARGIVWREPKPRRRARAAKSSASQ